MADSRACVGQPCSSATRCLLPHDRRCGVILGKSLTGRSVGRWPMAVRIHRRFVPSRRHRHPLGRGGDRQLSLVGGPPARRLATGGRADAGLPRSGGSADDGGAVESRSRGEGLAVMSGSYRDSLHGSAPSKNCTVSGCDGTMTPHSRHHEAVGLHTLECPIATRIMCRPCPAIRRWKTRHPQAPTC